jgi:mediator of RNA polymerase II transcription subunit 14
LNKGAPQVSGTFWDNLNTFAAGIIAQSVDIRELRRLKIKSQSSGSADLSLPQQVRMPSVEVALSNIFPSMMQEATENISPQGLSGVIEPNEDMQALSLLRPNSGSSSSAKQPWAEDMMAIRFKSVHTAAGRAELDGHASALHLVCTSEAVIRVRQPSKFLALKGMVDRDVSYDPKRGEFALQIQRPVTQPIFDTLKSRVKAIDRFVNFLEAMENAKGSIIGESIALKAVVFCYSAPVSTQPKDETAALVSSPERWRVKMDLSHEDIDIHIEKGNPHLRVIDLARNLASTEGGIGPLMAWLPVSLPALKAIDQLDAEWDELSKKGQGRLNFSMKSLTWMNIKYNIFEPNSAGAKTKRTICLDVRIRPRRGQVWWHAWRSDADAAADDEFSKALKTVWDGKGSNWLGLATGAAAEANDGVRDMLLAIDKAIRGAITASPGKRT